MNILSIIFVSFIGFGVIAWLGLSLFLIPFPLVSRKSIRKFCGVVVMVAPAGENLRITLREMTARDVDREQLQRNFSPTGMLFTSIADDSPTITVLHIGNEGFKPSCGKLIEGKIEQHRFFLHGKILNCMTNQWSMNNPYSMELTPLLS